MGCPVRVFQNRMHLSAVPPPEAKRPWWWGDHAIAFTAAKWSVYVWTGDNDCVFHTYNLLSFPPDARYWLSGDHLRPQTSWRWPTSLLSVTLAEKKWKMQKLNLVNKQNSTLYNNHHMQKSWQIWSFKQDNCQPPTTFFECTWCEWQYVQYSTCTILKHLYRYTGCQRIY